MSRPPTLEGERSRSRGGLTLPINSDSGIERQYTRRWHVAGEKDAKMEKKNNRSRLNQSTVCGVDLALKIKLAQTYLDEHKGLKNEEELLQWTRGIPSEILRILVLFIALNEFKSRV